MKNYKIEKGIEIPRRKCRKGYILFPFEKMGVGDSFFVPYNERKPESVQAQLSSNSKSYLRINNPSWKFTTNKQDKGVRIWRIK